MLVTLLAGAGQAQPASERLPTGLLPPTPEEQAWLEQNSHWVAFAEKELEDLPSRVVNVEHLPPVGRQVVGSCASWSVVYYVKGWQEAKEHGITRPFPEEHILSPAFVYYYVGVSAHEGSSFEANFEFLERHGTTTFSEFEESVFIMTEEPPSVEQWKEAARRRSKAGSFGRIPTGTAVGHATLKALLAGGDIASVGVGVADNFRHYPNAAESVDNGVLYAQSEGGATHHAVTIIGYDDEITYHNGTEERQGAFLAVNSWGTDWGVSAVEGGERGYIWLAYEYFLENPGATSLFDFYTMENLIDYEPRHFVILDIYHPRRTEMTVKFVAGPRDGQEAVKIVMAKSQRPLDTVMATDVTDLVGDDDEAFWLSVFDVMLPTLPSREPGVVRQFIVEQEGKLPLSAQQGLPLVLIDQLQFSTPSPQWVVAAPSYIEEHAYPSGSGHTAEVGELAGDGRPWLISGGAVLRMDGEVPVVERTLPGSSWQEIALGDYDNDGLPDLAVYGEFDGTWGIRIFRNQGGGRFAEEAAFPYPEAYATSGLHWVDFTGNGRLDLLAMNTSETRLFQNFGNGLFRDSGLGFPRGPSRVNMIVDFDQDGLMDFAGWRNLGDGNWQPPPWSDHSSLAWGDFDGDGLLDAAVPVYRRVEPGSNSWKYYTALYRNEGNGQFTLVDEALPGYNRDQVMRWGDVNNDGRLDLMVSGNLVVNAAITNQARAAIAFQGEDGAFRDSGLPLPPLGHGGFIIAADLDADGDLDIFNGGVPTEGAGTSTPGMDREARYTRSLFADAVGRLRPNIPPDVPGNLRANVETGPGAITLRWDAATDEASPQGGLRYQLRVGTHPGGHEVVSAGIALSELRPRRLAPGEPGARLSGLSSGNYYWSVRSADDSGGFSAWSPEAQFAILEGAPPVLPFDPNEDGLLDAADLAALRLLLGNSIPDDIHYADIDGSGGITERDLAALAGLLAGRPGALAPPWAGLMDGGGGVLVRGEARVVIPPGAIAGSPAMMRLDVAEDMPFGSPDNPENLTGPVYRLSGIPLELQKPIEVSLGNPYYWWEDVLVCRREEGYSPSRQSVRRYHSPVEPDSTDPDGTLHFRIEPLPEEVRKSLRSELVEGTYSHDFLILGGYSYYTTTNFRIAFPRSFDTEIVERLATDLENAHARFRSGGLGFSYAARTRWPLDVTLKDLGGSLYGAAYSSLRGPNYGTLEFNTQLIGDAQMRRVTAFHEFFHIVEALYDPRNRFSVAKFMAPHYILSEMSATWVEELAVEGSYVPSTWLQNYTAVLDPGGWDLPSSEGAGALASHGYGLSVAMKYLSERYGGDVIRKTFEGIRSGSSWTAAIASATGQSWSRWFHGFAVNYALGQVHPLEHAQLFGAATGRLSLSESKLSAQFAPKMPNLSAKLYSVSVPASSAGLVNPDHRLGFKLEGEAGTRLSVISRKRDEAGELVEFVPWDDGVSRLLSGKVYDVLSESGSGYFAVVTNDHDSPRNADPLEVNLTIGLVEDKTYPLEPFTDPGVNFFDELFPPLQMPGGSLFVPASGGMEVERLEGTFVTIATGEVWEDPGAMFRIEMPFIVTETVREREAQGEVWTASQIESYDLTVFERLESGDLHEVEVLTSTDGSFEFPAHYSNGRCEWELGINYTVTVTGSQTFNHQQRVPVLFFSAAAH